MLRIVPRIGALGRSIQRDLKLIIKALLLITGLVASASGTAGTHALLVGINDYTSLRGDGQADSSGRTWRDLKGAVNDAQSINALLQARYRVPAENVRLLTAESGGGCGAQGCPTRAAILSGLEQHLLAHAGPGEQLLFYYAGHGSQVGNPASGEQDEYDESLVPMDAVAGVPDIRDKQLRQLFNRMLDRGARLVVIVDSCHSGSISRGNSAEALNSRELEPLLQPLEDLGDPGPVPATRGAMVLSAASPSQLALEKKMPDDSTRGGFSYSLIKALMSAPSDEPLQRTFQRTEVFMKGLGLLQVPQLETRDGRRSEPLFAAARAAGSPADALVMVGIISVEDGVALVQGGKDVGLYPGTRLRIGKGGGWAELEIEENRGLTRSLARVLEGGTLVPASGDLATVTRWAGYEPIRLRAWVDGQPKRPVPAGLADELKAALAGEPSVSLAASPADADYVLSCRTAGPVGGAALACAWQLPGLEAGDRAGGLPAITDLVEVGQGAWQVAAEELKELALRLGKLKSWVSLASPPALLPYPYRLELRHAGSGETVDLERGVALGERYRIVLASPAEDVERAMIESRPRYVYVGGIDSRGNGYLLYPSKDPEYDHCAQLPCRTATRREYRPYYVVYEDYLVRNTETDLLYLITSEERIDPNILEFDGVRSSEAAEGVMRGDRRNGLEAVLAQYAGGRTRSGTTTPLNWSIDHYLVSVVDAPRDAPPNGPGMK